MGYPRFKKPYEIKILSNFILNLLIYTRTIIEWVKYYNFSNLDKIHLETFLTSFYAIFLSTITGCKSLLVKSYPIYSIFQAFKFPDEMDLVIECNVELCKTDCEMCPDDQKYEPGKRRRRDVTFNTTFSDLGSKVSGRFRVITPEDVAELNSRENLVAFIPGKL